MKELKTILTLIERATFPYLPSFLTELLPGGDFISMLRVSTLSESQFQDTKRQIDVKFQIR